MPRPYGVRSDSPLLRSSGSTPSLCHVLGDPAPPRGPSLARSPLSNRIGRPFLRDGCAFPPALLRGDALTPMEGTGLGTRSGCIVGKILGVCQSGGALWLPPLPQGWLPLSLPRPAQARRHRGKRWQGWGGMPSWCLQIRCPRCPPVLMVPWCPAPETGLPAGGGWSLTGPRPVLRTREGLHRG